MCGGMNKQTTPDQQEVTVPGCSAALGISHEMVDQLSGKPASLVEFGRVRIFV